jgi:hypothetical protein
MKASEMNPEEHVDDTSVARERVSIDDIVAGGPAGAFAVAGVAVGIVIALWFAFYFFVYLPRGAVQ